MLDLQLSGCFVNPKLELACLNRGGKVHECMGFRIRNTPLSCSCWCKSCLPTAVKRSEIKNIKLNRAIRHNQSDESLVSANLALDTYVHTYKIHQGNECDWTVHSAECRAGVSTDCMYTYLVLYTWKPEAEKHSPLFHPDVNRQHSSRVDQLMKRHPKTDELIDLLTGSWFLIIQSSDAAQLEWSMIDPRVVCQLQRHRLEISWQISIPIRQLAG